MQIAVSFPPGSAGPKNRSFATSISTIKAIQLRYSIEKEVPITVIATRGFNINISQHGAVRKRQARDGVGREGTKSSIHQLHVLSLFFRLISQLQNLSILYGADYFTEEEWIKFDGLLHKGRYVLSDGPANNILDAPLNNILDVPLMTFEESKDDIKDTVVEIPPDESFCQTRSDSMVASEESVSSPPSEHGDSLPSPPDHTSEAPVETSDEDSCSRRTSTAELGPEPGSEPVASDSTEPTTVRSAEPEHKPETKSLPPSRYTQEQLDEVRAFNAGLTKAGHKARPKYNHVEDDCSSEWIEEYNEPSGEERSYPSPPPTERLARINTWAGGVAKLPPLPPSHVESPTPNRSLPIAPAVEVLAEQFIKAHGRPHKSLNDFYQPNNPNHQLKRPKSQTSMKTTKTFATLRSAAPSAIEQIWNASPANGIVLGNVYTAQSGAPQRGIRFEVRPGDHIKVTKYVSGIMYIGENLRSKERGQFPESIFQRGSSSSHRSVIAERAAPSFQRGLDQIENANAAEWDDVASIKRPEPAAPISRPHLGGGLAASKFSTADRTPPRQSTQAQRGNIESDMAGQIEQIINDKVCPLSHMHTWHGFTHVW